MPDAPRFDPDLEWLDLVRPVGLVVAPSLLKELGLVPSLQTRADNAAVAELLRSEDPDDKHGSALSDAWAFVERILEWPASRVAGAPGGPPLPEDGLHKLLPEYDTVLEPHWAVGAPEGAWQLLVRIEAMGTKPDARGALAGWEATPHQRFERLLRELDIPIGVLITDEELRLIYAPSHETSGWIAFPLRPLATVAGRPMLGGLKLVLDRSRLFTDAENRRLPALLKASREAQTNVSTTLAEQVVGALHELLRGLTAAEPRLIGTLAAERPQLLYEGLLTVLMRLVFTLYAEDRNLIPSRTDERARDLYAQGYSVRGLYGKLLEDQARYPDTMDERRGAWGRLIALFRLIHAGDHTGWIRARGGKLFDPDAFPFLEGRTTAEELPRIIGITDGCVLRILDGLLTLKGERLSYRTLDVEQIGSVYEIVMGFTVQPASGPVLAIRAGKHNRTPVFVELAELAALGPNERLKRLKEGAQRSSLTDRQQRAIKASTDVDELAAALDSIVDERGSPEKRILRVGTPILQPTAERRRTGSHYTPRSLTEPIVRHALEPAFERLGPDARPEDVLNLKVCDPAMGSGAFLVEACRAIASRMVAAWSRWPETRPTVPADEDEELHARRLVAQRCLYGIDKNPRAVDLARLSLWLVTLAKDHEFTFLDHALKCGDSLVGLDAAQIAAMHWDASKPGLPLFRQFVADRVAEATKARAEIQSAPDDTMRVILEQKHRFVESRVEHVRVLGDAVLTAFFAEDKPKAREKRRATIESWVASISSVKWNELEAAAASLQVAEHPLPPFHWAIEFPEVFEPENPGFDAIVGNPPFLGGKRISTELGSRYRDWLFQLHQANQNTDLVGHFFRRSFVELAQGGVLGLVATNTIAQGATREGALVPLLTKGGSIFRVRKRMPWPGDAAVVVSVIHITRGPSTVAYIDGKPKTRISAYLIEGDMDYSPATMRQNARRAFVGSYLLGMGFTFDDEAAAKGEAEPISAMVRLIEGDRHNQQIIQPFIGADEINSEPSHHPSRYVINFSDLPLRREQLKMHWSAMNKVSRDECRRNGVVPVDYPDSVAEDWPKLLDIVRVRVKPLRDRQGRVALVKRWWQFAEKQRGLYNAIDGLDRVIVAPQTSKYINFTILPQGIVYSHKTIVFASGKMSLFCVLQSRPHLLWAHHFGSTMKDDPVYTPSDCFETFPLPEMLETSSGAEAAGKAYYDHRAALMVTRNEGMTKTYNRFHGQSETVTDIVRLRELHAEMDRAVLEAYGWRDLAERAAPIFLDETNEDDHTYQGRLFWPSDFRDEVLARLLALNAERHAEEVRLGIAPRMKGQPEVEDDEEASQEELTE